MNQASQIQASRRIESVLENERHTFEQFAYRRHLSETHQISELVQSAQPITIQALCWRIPDGTYGVDRINAAWLGWKARAMYQILMDLAAEQAMEGTGNVD